jgi:hypothetical protein
VYVYVSWRMASLHTASNHSVTCVALYVLDDAQAERCH